MFSDVRELVKAGNHLSSQSHLMGLLVRVLIQQSIQ